jgi:hypothetical protein
MDNNAMKIGIVSGIISSLIVILFIQPIMSFTWDTVVGMSGAIQQEYVDRIYRNAALADRNLIGHMAFIVLILFLYIGSGFLMLGVTATPPRVAALSRFVRISSALAGIFLSVILLVAFSLSSGIMEISASFSQRVTVLAPAVSDSEYKTLRARWASMRGEADYQKIIADMEKRATELAITLPPVRKP